MRFLREIRILNPDLFEKRSTRNKMGSGRDISLKDLYRIEQSLICEIYERSSPDWQFTVIARTGSRSRGQGFDFRNLSDLIGVVPEDQIKDVIVLTC